MILPRPFSRRPSTDIDPNCRTVLYPCNISNLTSAGHLHTVTQTDVQSLKPRCSTCVPPPSLMSTQSHASPPNKCTTTRPAPHDCLEKPHLSRQRATLFCMYVCECVQGPSHNGPHCGRPRTSSYLPHHFRYRDSPDSTPPVLLERPHTMPSAHGRPHTLPCRNAPTWRRQPRRLPAAYY